MFRNLEAKVNLVNTREQLLEFLDDEICDALSYHLRKRGALIRHGSDEKVEPRDDGVVLSISNREAVEDRRYTWANGARREIPTTWVWRPWGSSPTIAGTSGERKLPHERDAHLRRRRRHWHPLARQCRLRAGSLCRVAYHSRRFRAGHGPRHTHRHLHQPREISRIGKTEGELTKAKIPYEVVTRSSKACPAQITGADGGDVRCCSTASRLALLGIHSLGRITEIIHIGQQSCRRRVKRRRCCTSSTRHSTTPRWPKPTCRRPQRLQPAVLIP